MEKIQSRALKFIYDDTDSTYEELLTKSKLPHVLAAKYLKVLIPYLVVLVDGILTVFWYLKEYLLCLIVIKSCKYK
jgi:hypothetical protein